MFKVVPSWARSASGATACLTAGGRWSPGWHSYPSPRYAYGVHTYESPLLDCVKNSLNFIYSGIPFGRHVCYFSPSLPRTARGQSGGCSFAPAGSPWARTISRRTHTSAASISHLGVILISGQYLDDVTLVLAFNDVIISCGKGNQCLANFQVESQAGTLQCPLEQGEDCQAVDLVPQRHQICCRSPRQFRRW